MLNSLQVTPVKPLESPLYVHLLKRFEKLNLMSSSWKQEREEEEAKRGVCLGPGWGGGREAGGCSSQNESVWVPGNSAASNLS